MAPLMPPRRRRACVRPPDAAFDVRSLVDAITRRRAAWEPSGGDDVGHHGRRQQHLTLRAPPAANRAAHELDGCFV